MKMYKNLILLCLFCLASSSWASQRFVFNPISRSIQSVRTPLKLSLFSGMELHDEEKGNSEPDRLASGIANVGHLTSTIDPDCGGEPDCSITINYRDLCQIDDMTLPVYVWKSDIVEPMPISLGEFNCQAELEERGLVNLKVYAGLIEFHGNESVLSSKSFLISLNIEGENSFFYDEGFNFAESRDLSLSHLKVSSNLTTQNTPSKLSRVSLTQEFFDAPTN